MQPDSTSFELQADLCLALANATRLRIIQLLKDGPRRVCEIARQLEVNQPTTSRHLTVLRNAGILEVHRQGADVLYQISNPKILEVCDLMRGLLAKRESRKSEMLLEFDSEWEGRSYAL